jgi:hypothetical protein
MTDKVRKRRLYLHVIHHRRNLLAYNVCFDFLYKFETFLILRRIQQDFIINVVASSCEVGLLVILFRFQ